jgi:23S rRNA pseudouridine2605 synthase
MNRRETAARARGSAVPTMRVRLHKFLAEAGVASRRACETLILAGEVCVNGRAVLALGTKIDPVADTVTVKSRPVSPERKLYVALNKPTGVVCTSRDPHGAKRVVSLLPRSFPRLYTVGRLDKETEGLIFLTNDGTFSLRLTHPRYKMSKTYLVEVEGELKSSEIARLYKGVRSQGQLLRAEKVSQVRHRGRSTELRLVLREGRNRHIRRMMGALGHPVRRLVRLAVGPVELGDLKAGQWRYLTNEELCKLKHFSPAL